MTATCVVASLAVGAAIKSLLPSLAPSPQLGVTETEPGLHHYLPDQNDSRVVAIAKECRYYSPKFSPKDVPAFYDLSGITENPRAFQDIMAVFIERYRAQIAAGKGPTVIVGYDARGFVVGPPIALALGIPFVLLRKAGKNPGPLVRSYHLHSKIISHASHYPCFATICRMPQCCSLKHNRYLQYHVRAGGIICLLEGVR